MQSPEPFQIAGISPTMDEKHAAYVRSRLIKLAEYVIEVVKEPRVDLRIRAAGSQSGQPSAAGGEDQEEMTTEARAARYKSRPPVYQFEQLIVSETVRSDLLLAAAVLRVREKVFGEWGLARIEPYPRSVLNFHGPSGTGKTLAAHALAAHLGVPILAASYADIESKFLGSGPRNLEALFFAAERDGALLFVDEADSLLSARVGNAQSGSEKAVNSLRSQLLICLEKFKGVVVFASNFVESYDKAFKTRVRDVFFPLPDAHCRSRLWQVHLPPELPIDGVDAVALSDASDGMCGRDIKNVVIDAAVRCAVAGRERLSAADFLSAIERLKTSREEGRAPKLSPELQAKARDQLLAVADHSESSKR